MSDGSRTGESETVTEGEEYSEEELEAPPEASFGQKEQNAAKGSNSLSHLVYHELCDIQCVPILRFSVRMNMSIASGYNG
jgi:hypothetical protein